ncbi:MAG: N-acetyltransferase [Flavobacterium sp.]|nr:MAG: N-acetyltransferase [Flavobacterium sp.]
MNIEITSNPKEEDLKVLSDGIKRYNQEYLPDQVVFEEDTKFAVFAKDDNGTVLGGIRACGYWNYCLLELLWLSEKTRRSGVGSKLVEAFEEFAALKGFNYIRTETVSFQARPFYEKLGYTVYGELPDFPKGHTTYCLFKELT